MRDERKLHAVKETLSQLMWQIADCASPKLSSLVMDREPKPGYVSRIRKYRGPLRDGMWIGFAHRKFEKPRTGVQFQFGIDQDQVWSNGIWIQYDVPARGEAQRQLWANFGKFRRALKKLPRGYTLQLWRPGGNRPSKQWPVKTARTTLEDFLHQMGDENVHVHVGLRLSKQKAIQLEEDLPETIARNFNKLLPLYSLMIGGSSGKPPPHPAPLPTEEDLLYALQTARRGGKRGGQGLRVSPEMRKAIEHHAMDEARRHFRTCGYSVRNVSKNHPYDLRCRKKREIHVEVKGTRTAGEKIILTRNEVEHAKDHRRNMALFVLRDVKISRKNGRVIASGGRRDVTHPWRINETLLEPIGFEYQLVKERRGRRKTSRR
jgi:hypothetical protein